MLFGLSLPSTDQRQPNFAFITHKPHTVMHWRQRPSFLDLDSILQMSICRHLVTCWTLTYKLLPLLHHPIFLALCLHRHFGCRRFLPRTRHMTLWHHMCHHQWRHHQDCHITQLPTNQKSSPQAPHPVLTLSRTTWPKTTHSDKQQSFTLFLLLIKILHSSIIVQIVMMCCGSIKIA